MIKAVIFDIGNVLTDFAWQEMYKEKGLGGETYERVAKATVQSPYWCELDRGVMAFEEVMERVTVGEDKVSEQEQNRLLRAYATYENTKLAISAVSENSAGFGILSSVVAAEVAAARSNLGGSDGDGGCSSCGG